MYQVTATHKSMMRMRMSKEMQRLKQGRKEGRYVSSAMAAAYIVYRVLYCFWNDDLQTEQMDHDSVSSRKRTLIRAISGDKRHFLSA